MSVYKPSIGDRVNYSARFLRSIQGHEVAHRIGTVRALKQCGSTIIARIEWDDDPAELSSALPVNIARAHSWRAVDPTATR